MERLLLPFKKLNEIYENLFIPVNIKVMGILCLNNNLITRAYNTFQTREIKNSMI
jgi:hypothetical protein